MKIDISDTVENEDGSQTIVISGDKENMEALMSAMFSHFLSTAIGLVKEENMKTLDDDSFSLKIKYEDLDTIENRLIQAKGILNITMDAYSASEFEDLQGVLWTLSEMIKEITDILEKK